MFIYFDYPKIYVPKNTSQMCSRCGMLVKKDLSVRVHNCWNCGLTIDRDLNAAINIQNRSGWGSPVAPVELETASKRETLPIGVG